MTRPSGIPPKNDPENEFGWKNLRNKQTQLEYECLIEKEKYLSEIYKTRYTSMDTTDVSIPIYTLNFAFTLINPVIYSNYF